uniref:Uncharacterized protein n=1 Tax=viral metagenome TaxID=1070528 RepID=A0A6M3J651_9ZZZZ
MTDHLEVTAGIDMDAYSHQDSPSAPVQPVRIGLEPVEEKVSDVSRGF